MTSRQEFDALFSVVYEDLRRLAHKVKSNDPSATLNPTALVHEAWVKLAKSPELAGTSPAHFKHIAGRAIRQILVEAARRRNAGKRGNGAAIVEFEMALAQAPSTGKDVMALEEALQELARVDPRQAEIVEAKFFGGLTASEIAALLGISEETVLRDWRAAKAWLGYRLRKAG